MAMTPEELNELKKLEQKDLLLLTYQLAHETNETVGKLVPRVQHLERFKLKVQGAWAAAVILGAAAGFKIGKEH